MALFLPALKLLIHFLQKTHSFDSDPSCRDSNINIPEKLDTLREKEALMIKTLTHLKGRRTSAEIKLKTYVPSSMPTANSGGEKQGWFSHSRKAESFCLDSGSLNKRAKHLQQINMEIEKQRKLSVVSFSFFLQKLFFSVWIA